MPPAHLLPERTGGVLAVLSLLFNEGYAATAGADLVRHALSAEAIRVVALNRAVAVSMAGYHLLPATRADLLRRLDRHEEAAAAYREALDLASTEAERRYLARRLAENGGA